MYGTEEGVGMQGQYADVDPFEMFNIFFQNSGFGPMGGGFPRGGRTKVTFSNGGTTYSFSSFGGGDDDDDIPGIDTTGMTNEQISKLTNKGK